MARKAISPLIATLILIAITITGGVVVYRLFYSTSNALTNTIQLQVTEASASETAGFSFNLKNTGSGTIAAVTVANAPGLTTCTLPAGGLAAGQSISCAGGTPVQGTTYVAQFKATSGSNTYTTQFTVVAGP